MTRLPRFGSAPQTWCHSRDTEDKLDERDPAGSRSMEMKKDHALFPVIRGSIREDMKDSESARIRTGDRRTLPNLNIAADVAVICPRSEAPPWIPDCADLRRYMEQERMTSGSW